MENQALSAFQIDALVCAYGRQYVVRDERIN